MKLPYSILDVDDRLREKWLTYFEGQHDRDRNIEEGIWRRTQDPANAEQSGWTPESNARRRIVHYRYKYGLGERSLNLDEFYLYHCITSPAGEIDSHEASIRQHLLDGGWSDRNSHWTRGDLECIPTRYTVHPKDKEAGRQTPGDYDSYEVVVKSSNSFLSSDVISHPWDVLAGGIRIKDERGKPTVVESLESIKDYMPFQVEVGCGTSFEAGIPALHRLHEIYRVTSREDDMPGQYAFTMNPGEDTLLEEVLVDPESKFLEFVEMVKACFLADPTPALEALQRLTERGAIVGPIITNNFDVLTARAGLEECFVRRYDQRIPDVPFLPEAKALLVVGNHADRRKVQARARERGMKLFYLDPEGFWFNDEFAPYPLESPKDGDVLCHKSANDGLTELARILL